VKHSKAECADSIDTPFHSSPEFRDITERRMVEQQKADRLANTGLLASIVEFSEDAIPGNFRELEKGVAASTRGVGGRLHLMPATVGEFECSSSGNSRRFQLRHETPRRTPTKHFSLRMKPEVDSAHAASNDHDASMKSFRLSSAFLKSQELEVHFRPGVVFDSGGPFPEERIQMLDTPQYVDPCEPFRGYLRVLAVLQLDRRLQSKVDASDIVQRTMLKAHASLPSLQDQRPPVLLAWLRQILTNELTDAVKHFQRDKRDIGLEKSIEQQVDESACRMESWLAADHSTPSQRAVRNEDMLRLADALLQLPDDQREVVVLKHLKDMPLSQIAADTGRTTASVAGLLRRGLERLRELLGDTNNDKKQE